MAKGYGRPPMSRKGGKGMGMGMPGLNMDMIKQAQKMQADMEKTQAELQEKEYTATAGGGVVSATVDGKHMVKAITIDPEAVDPDDVEMLCPWGRRCRWHRPAGQAAHTGLRRPWPNLRWRPDHDRPVRWCLRAPRRTGLHSEPARWPIPGG